VAKHKIYCKGEGDDFLKPELRWVLRVRVCSWFVSAPKCFNHALTNFFQYKEMFFVVLSI
jgi:hypothetical protein